MYDTRIIQHAIPLKEDAKVFQKKSHKVHPTLESII
jgi:hypothetical protein